jgi:hypothetical protein
MNEVEHIQNMIYELRGNKVMLDSDLARLYQVETRVLNQAVKRNSERFPDDFMFRLTQVEWETLKSQFVTSSWGGIRKLPYAFTEQGVAMLSGVLKSSIAIDMNIKIMRVFIQMRQFALSQSDTSERIAELRKLLMLHIKDNENYQTNNDKLLNSIMAALNSLVVKPPTIKPIGFKTGD